MVLPNLLCLIVKLYNNRPGILPNSNVRLFYMIFLEQIFFGGFGERVKVSCKRSRQSFVSDSCDGRKILVKEDTCVRVCSGVFGCVRFLGNSSVFCETLCFYFKNYLYLAVCLG